MRLATEGSKGGNGPLGAASIREVHHILSGAYRAAIRSGAYGVVLSPTHRANPPSPREVRSSQPEFKTWSGPQLRAFLALVRDDHYNALWNLLAATGLRRGEAPGARWGDLDFGNGRLSVRQTIGEDRIEVRQPDGSIVCQRVLITGTTKGNRPRVASLDHGTLAILRAHRSQQVLERMALIALAEIPQGCSSNFPTWWRV